MIAIISGKALGLPLSITFVMSPTNLSRRKCENSTRVVFSRSPGTEIYSSFDTPLGSFTGEDGVSIPPRVEYRVEFLPPKFHPLFHSY